MGSRAIDEKLKSGSELFTAPFLKDNTTSVPGDTEEAKAAAAYFRAVAAYDASARENAKKLAENSKKIKELKESGGNSYTEQTLTQEKVKLTQKKNELKKEEKRLTTQGQALSKLLPSKQEAFLPELDKVCTTYNGPESPTADTTDIPRALDDATHAVFLINGLFLAAILRIEPTLALNIAAAAMGCIWNKWDGGAGLASIDQSGEKTSEHDKFWDKVQTFSNVQLLLATTVNTAYFIFELAAKMGSTLASTVITNAPAALGMLNGPSFALCMALSTVNEIDSALEARRKRKDPQYFAQTCREAVTAELDLLLCPCQTAWERLTNQPAKLPTMEQLIAANERIKRLTADAKALEYYPEYQGKGQQERQKASTDTNNRHNIIHAKLLMEQQAQKEKEHWLKAGVWAAATGVMTAACVGMPPFVIFGIVVVGAIKMMQTVASRIMDDYNKEAVAYAASPKKPRDTASKTEEELYAAALRRKIEKINVEENISSKVTDTDIDIDAMKTRLSGHRQDFICTEAKRDYTVSLYLNRKADQMRNKASKLGTKVSSFFSEISLPAGSEVALEADLYATGRINPVPR